jgi:hypothetical protein
VPSPNKVVGITQVPSVDFGAILVEANVSGHFQGFRGFRTGLQFACRSSGSEVHRTDKVGLMMDVLQWSCD